MKNLIMVVMILTGFLGFGKAGKGDDPSKWSDQKIEKWFNEKKWLNGWSITPDPSINKRELAVAYFNQQERWDKAFRFLKENDLTKLEQKRYDIDGDNVYASVSEYSTKDPETANFEAHRKYADIQYVISGSEIINIASLNQAKEIVIPYDESKDIEFIRIDNIVSYKAESSKFYIFFPDDAHRPQIKDGEKSHVRKIVIKVKV